MWSHLTLFGNFLVTRILLVISSHLNRNLDKWEFRVVVEKVTHTGFACTVCAFMPFRNYEIITCKKSSRPHRTVNSSFSEYSDLYHMTASHHVVMTVISR